MGLFDSFKEWQSGRRERRIEKLTAKAADLGEDQQYDLLFLHKKGFVRAKGSGQSITKIYAEIENLIRKKLHVDIKPGTYFVSSGGHQNMATTKKYSFTLYPSSTEHIGINAVCINANRPIPNKSDQFYGVACVSDEVAKFLEASKNEDPMVIQAGVWTLTDKYSRRDVINRLISRDNSGDTKHPITHDHCDKAKAILDQLGIPHQLGHSDISYEKKTIDYSDGTYTGEFQNGKPHGHGKYKFKDGGSHEGEWKSGHRHGLGKTIMKDYIWEGEYENNTIKKGVLTWPDGKKYVGEFKRSQPHGKGEITYVDGAKYIGEVEKGECHGKGKIMWANGSSIEGEWNKGILLVTGPVGRDYSEKIIERFDGTKDEGGWLHFTDGTKIWIFINSAGEWEDADYPGFD